MGDINLEDDEPIPETHPTWPVPKPDFSEGPRYLTIRIYNAEQLQAECQRVMRPGDRIVSVYPTSGLVGSDFPYLQVLLELRHLSWAIEGKGWTGSITLDD